MQVRQKKLLLLVPILIAVPLLLILATNVYASSPGKAIKIVGSDNVIINQEISSDFRFLPNGLIHVKSGDTIILTDSTDEPHTLTLLDSSLLPSSFDEIFACGGPGTVCGPILAGHFPNGFGPQGPIPPFNVYLDNGSPSATPPALDTPFTLSTGGDSALIFPAQTITMTITAPPGSVFHFFCVIHPWMQGEIVVDG